MKKTETKELTPDGLQKMLDDAQPLADARAAELSLELGTEITPLLFIYKNELVTGYLKPPHRILKMQIMDAAITGRGFMITAGHVESQLVTHASDPRLWSQKPEFDDLYLGVTMAIYNDVHVLSNQAKKKVAEWIAQYSIDDNSADEKKWSALLRFYSHFNLDPDMMDEEQFWKAVMQLKWVLGFTGVIGGK